MKTNKTAENKYNNHEHLRTRHTSMEHNSEEEYYNFSDSSLELFDTFKPKSKKNKNYKQSSNSIIVSDIIDLTNESDMKLKRNNISKDFLNDLSICNISSSSNESFKSATSILSNSNNINNLENINNGNQNNNSLTKMIHFDSENNLSDSNKSFLKYNITSTMSNSKKVKHSEYQYNYATPKEKQIQNNYLTESAKLLDRIYGKEWRSVDGVIKNSKKKKKLSDEDFVNYNE